MTDAPNPEPRKVRKLRQWQKEGHEKFYQFAEIPPAKRRGYKAFNEIAAQTGICQTTCKHIVDLYWREQLRNLTEKNYVVLGPLGMLRFEVREGRYGVNIHAMKRVWVQPRLKVAYTPSKAAEHAAKLMTQVLLNDPELVERHSQKRDDPATEAEREDMRRKPASSTESAPMATSDGSEVE